MGGGILVTGCEGLVGSALTAWLRKQAFHLTGLDVRARDLHRGDVCDGGDVGRAFASCRGVVHLAAVSRVVWAEREPELCRSTNVGGTENVLRAALASRLRPWVIFVSSREVYGQQDALPVDEDAPLRPVNVYGRAKVRGEELAIEARAAGLRTAIVRLSNVYGSTRDHADRVIPAFARGAVLGRRLRVDGAGHVFDFTHLDDVVRGLVGLVEAMTEGGAPLPPVHLLTGVPTSLRDLARMAIDAGGTDATIVEAPPRSYDVARFYGDPSRAHALLGWRARVGIREGVARLVEDFRAELRPAGAEVRS